jgi:hypothetical protein
VKVDRTVAADWATLVGGAWAGPAGFAADGARYAGAWRLVDVDEDAPRAGLHGQARRVAGWGGVTLTLEARPAGPDAGAPVALTGAALLVGAAGPAAADALLDELEALLVAAAPVVSPADDPAWRRRLAWRAAVAVGVGVAAGVAGAAWDRRRRT